MKKLLLSALVVLFTACQSDEFDYFFTIKTTIEPFCQSSFDFPKQVITRFEVKDFTDSEALLFEKENTFEKIVTKTLDGKETKAIFRSEVATCLTRTR